MNSNLISETHQRIIFRYWGSEFTRLGAKLVLFLGIWKFQALGLELLYRMLNSFPPSHPLQRLPHKTALCVVFVLVSYLIYLVSAAVKL